MSEKNHSTLKSESVWDYPRPPLVEPTNLFLQVYFDGIKLAETKRAYRVLETSHPPVYYFPPEDVLMEYLIPTSRRSYCEWKGQASYYTIKTPAKIVHNAAWYYPNPTPPYSCIANHIAFYPQYMDQCYVEGELVKPQPGNFYGGWITSNLIGPFKGEAGSENW
ncbi:MAG: DUF427 domain-containing protein [Bellilinea sp.]